MVEVTIRTNGGITQGRFQEMAELYFSPGNFEIIRTDNRLELYNDNIRMILDDRLIRVISDDWFEIDWVLGAIAGIAYMDDVKDEMFWSDLNKLRGVVNEAKKENGPAAVKEWFKFNPHELIRIAA